MIMIIGNYIILFIRHFALRTKNANTVPTCRQTKEKAHISHLQRGGDIFMLTHDCCSGLQSVGVVDLYGAFCSGDRSEIAPE